jgi:hypothetical protein
MQRGNRRDQIHAGLSGIEQCSGRLQMQRSPAACRDPLDEQVGAGLAFVHRAQQPAVRDTGGASEHAGRAGRAGGDVGRGAAGGCPRRCGRQHDVDDERDERQHDKPPDKRRPVASAAQPEHAGDDIGQDEKRHVDAADDHFPPRRLRHFDALLQPHRRHGAEEQPAVRLWLEMPQGGRSEQRCGASTEVVNHQDQREREPVAHDREQLVSTTDAGRSEPGRDIDQQQLAVERESVGQTSVSDNQCPHGDCHPPGQRPPSLPSCRRANRFDRPDRLDRHGREVPAATRLLARQPWFAHQQLGISTGCD